MSSEAQALDASALVVIVVTMSSLTVMILPALLYGQLIYLPRLRAEVQRSSAAAIYARTQTPALRVLLNCGLMILLMLAASSSLVAAMVGLGPQPRPGHRAVGGVPASINFCEEDFVHSSLVAEPANTISSLMYYPVLAWLGTRGPAPGNRLPPRRFVVGMLMIVVIGMGSTSLHALLIASAQGGDELPMLWYCAIAAFIMFDVNLDTMGSAKGSRAWLGWLFGGAAAASTAVYVSAREDFTVFFVTFALYGAVISIGLIRLGLFVDWMALRGPEGGAAMVGVIGPLALATAYCTILGIWVWAGEMNLCGVVQHGGEQGGWTVLPFLFNRVLHPLWHATSALVAWLILQVLLAAHGVLRHGEWGAPTCSGLVPRVRFVPHSSD